jgi:hypothetical protein
VTSSVGDVTAHPGTLELVSWDGPWDPDDPDANFKADVALYSHVDPMTTIDNLAAALNMPAGAVVHYIIARWASAGSGALLELGPTMCTGFGRSWRRPRKQGPTRGAWRPTRGCVR